MRTELPATRSGGLGIRHWAGNDGTVREALLYKLDCSKLALGGGPMGIGWYQGGTRPVAGYPAAGETGRMDSEGLW